MLRTLALMAFFMMMGMTSVYAVDSYVVPNGSTSLINEFTSCRLVTNGHASGISIMVPTRTAAEWDTGATAFLNTLPAGVTAVACDTTPNAFNFTPDVTGAALNTLTAASAITIGGINSGSPVSVSGGEVSINGGGWVTSGTITNGQTLAVRLTSSASFSTALTATVNVGGVTDTWSVTSRPANNCTVAAGTNWTVTSNTCQAPSAVNINHGASGGSTDSTAPTTGAATWACNDGTPTIQPGATCTNSACGGHSAGGYCWYLTTSSVSCNTFCASRGGCNVNGLQNYAGQLGSNANCYNLLESLGALTPGQAVLDASSSRPIACFAYSTGGGRFRITSRAATCAGSNTTQPILRLACSCNN